MIKGLKNMSEDEKNKLMKLSTMSLFVPLYNKPFSDFHQLLHLKSVEFDIDLTENYASDKQCTRFVYDIAEAVKCDIKDLLHIKITFLCTESRFIPLKSVPKADAECH